jgi:hypothetical protein
MKVKVYELIYDEVVPCYIENIESVKKTSPFSLEINGKIEITFCGEIEKYEIY